MENYINNLTKNIQKEFINSIKYLKKNDCTIIMPTYFPQRGQLLSEISKYCNTLLVGGLENQKIFKNVRQYGLPYDTTALGSLFSVDAAKDIINTIPEENLQNKNIAVFLYDIKPSYPLSWINMIENRNLNTNIFASNFQNTADYFEEKANLSEILKVADLKNYEIPSIIIENNDTANNELSEIYNKYKNNEGKIVIQTCSDINGNTSSLAGGEGTFFVDDIEAFISLMKNNKGAKKIAPFIKGVQSNVSFVVGNLINDSNNLGSKKVNLSNNVNPFNPESIYQIMNNVKNLGINKSNIISVFSRPTLKVVGDKNLTNEEGNGVGNDLGYVYPKEIQEQIFEIQSKLSKIMGLSGRVGLVNIDLIIDMNNNKVLINEINDREGGPLNQISKDAENNGLPPLNKLNWLLNFADINNENVKDLLMQIDLIKEDIYYKSCNSKGSFYIKINAKDENMICRKNTKPGIYNFSKEINSYNITKSNNEELPEIKNFENFDAIIEGGELFANTKIPQGAQIMRIEGNTSNGYSPFTIKNNKSILNPDWIPIVNSFYNKYTYNEKNIKKPKEMINKQKDREYGDD